MSVLLRKRWFQQVLVAILLMFAALAYLVFDFARFAKSSVAAPDQAFVYTLTPGTSLSRLSTDLFHLGVISHPNYFRGLGKLLSLSTQLKAGEYLIEGSQTPSGILQQISAGNVVQHTLTIVEGWRVFDLVKAIEANQYIEKTLDYKSIDTLLAQLNINAVYPEGLFYPDTYHFPAGTSDREVLLRAYQAMQDHLKTTWINRALDLPYKTPYQALIAASLIEKETAVVDEKALVASVIVNRLNKKMPLQIDPTVIYGLKKAYRGVLHKQDLQRDTVYNTYRHRGLPPTPIAMPSVSSIQAALHPANTAFYYFVAKGDGTHHFSRTLKEQNRAVRQYILKTSHSSVR